MIRFVVFVALACMIFAVLFLFGKMVITLLKTSQASNLEKDIEKGEKAKETIEILNQKIKSK